MCILLPERESGENTKKELKKKDRTIKWSVCWWELELESVSVTQDGIYVCYQTLRDIGSIVCVDRPIQQESCGKSSSAIGLSASLYLTMCSDWSGLPGVSVHHLYVCVFSYICYSCCPLSMVTPALNPVSDRFRLTPHSPAGHHYRVYT